MKYTKLMAVLSEITTNPKKPIIVYLENGLVFQSSKNIGIYESDNALDLEDEQYFEYYACAIEVTKILSIPTHNNYNIDEFKIGSLIELSELNEPLKIELSNGKIIWEQGDC